MDDHDPKSVRPPAAAGSRSRLGRLLPRRRTAPPKAIEPGDGGAAEPVAPPAPAASWEGLAVPQLPDLDPPSGPVALVTSTFHAARAPQWATVIHPNRVAALPGEAAALVIDASAAGPFSSWSGMDGSRLAIHEGALRLLAELGDAGVTTVFRWDVTHPSPGLVEMAARCRVVVAAPGAEWSGAALLPHGIDSKVFTPGHPVTRSAVTRTFVDGSGSDDGATIDQRLVHDPRRFVAALHTIDRLVIAAAGTPTTRHVASEAAACGVEVIGGEAPPPITATEELDRLASLYLSSEGIASPGDGEKP